MFSIYFRRNFHLFDPAIAKRIDRPPPVQPQIAAEHEVDTHPWLFDNECVEHIPGAGQQTLLAKLKGWVDVVVPVIQPEHLVALPHAAEFQGRDAQFLEEPFRRENSTFRFEHFARSFLSKPDHLMQRIERFDRGHFFLPSRLTPRSFFAPCRKAIRIAIPSGRVPTSSSALPRFDPQCLGRRPTS